MRSLRPNSNLVKRFAAILMLILWLGVSANAYTIVMRGGRKVEIPSTFTVTATTLTYEVGEGVQVSLQMAAIDVAATEKVNHESPGSLLKRIQPDSSRHQPTGRANRTITNDDLKMSAQRRRLSEEAYEVRRKELGLPSVEESRRKSEAEAESIRVELREQRAADMETESYWRGRANELRTEMAAIDAELSYVRRRLDEVPNYSWGVGYSSFTTVVPFGSFGRVGGSFGFGRTGGFGSHQFGAAPFHRPMVYAAPAHGPQVTPRVGFGGQTRGQVFVNRANRFHRGGFGNRFPGVPAVPVFGLPLYGSIGAPYDFSYERGELITRFNELSATRAGLKARWRELEEEARRAGAMPGWLRP